MTTRAWKILFVLGAVTGAVVLVVTAQPEFLAGRLAFFKQSPTGTEAVNGSYMGYQDAAMMLINAALKTRRITSDAAEALRREFFSAGDRSITRAEFASLSVRIFGIENYGYGTRFSDLPGDAASTRDIYLFNSNGGLEEFKPSNPVTKMFADKTVQEFNLRFASSGK